jgi:hypothetical protein
MTSKLAIITTSKRKHGHHNGGFIDGRCFFHQMQQFFQEVVDVNALSYNQTDVERGLEPSAQENKAS